MAIAEVYPDRDLTLYLEEHEVDILKDDFIHGPLVHSHLYGEQGYFSMTSSTYWPKTGLERPFSVKRQDLNESSIGVWNIFLKDPVVDDLEKGGSHGRYGNFNNKYHIHVDDEEKNERVDYLWRLRDEKEKIREEFFAGDDQKIWDLR
ncbi:MAG: hypothetical protein ABEJ99_05560 [Candidatus Nanohaloarchaea archaeon]